MGIKWVLLRGFQEVLRGFWEWEGDVFIGNLSALYSFSNVYNKYTDITYRELRLNGSI